MSIQVSLLTTAQSQLPMPIQEGVSYESEEGHHDAAPDKQRTSLGTYCARNKPIPSAENAERFTPLHRVLAGTTRRRLDGKFSSPVTSVPIRPRRRTAEVATCVAMPAQQMLADEWAYCVTATNAAVGSSSYALQTTYDPAVGLFAVFNANQAGGPRIFLNHMRLVLAGTAPTGTTVMHFAVRLSRASLMPTAGAMQAMPCSPNTDATCYGKVMVWAFSGAALTLPSISTSDARILARASIQTGAAVPGDQYVLQFGMNRPFAAAGLTAGRDTTSPTTSTTNIPGIALGPQQWALVHMWWTGAATNVPAFEYELGWWER